MALRLDKKPSSAATIVVSGKLDASEAAPLRSAINDHLIAGTNRIVVDLTDVNNVDSAGLAALVIGMKRARLADGDVRLVRPRDPEAKRAFERTKFDEVFIMVDDLEIAYEGW